MPQNSFYITKPHAPSAIGVSGDQRAYTYDKNGNSTGFTFETQIRSLAWDEENRLKGFDETLDGTTHMREYYTYNESGDRITKKHEDSTVTPAVTEITEYPNRYTGVLMDASGSGKVTTKNIYVGPQIMASVMKSGPANSDTFTYTYYYHTDHLGSSTYLTDDTGAIKEHIEYTPWGESWYEPANMEPLKLPNYKYTGKEQDATKLYYYGARYYDPQTSVWLSTDEAFDRYLDGSVNEGIYNSLNFGLYTYGYQNPIRYIDSDGNCVALAIASMESSGAGAAAGLQGNNANGQVLASAISGVVDNIIDANKTAIAGASVLAGTVIHLIKGDEDEKDKKNKNESSVENTAGGTAPATPPGDFNDKKKDEKDDTHIKDESIEPKNLEEKLNMEEIKSGNTVKDDVRIIKKENIRNPKYEHKFDKIARNKNGVEYHYMRNPETKRIIDVKIIPK
jgi:RHS repeat-associated protein